MTREETVKLTRYVKACCPQQQIDGYTPDAWHELLGHLEMAECTDAATAIAQRQPFVSPSEIISEVRALRRDRLDRQVVAAPPAGMTDEPARYRAELEASVKRIADGYRMPPALPRSPVREGLPPQEYLEARAALDRHLADEGIVSRDSEESLRALARRQAAESRAEHAGMAPDLGEDLAPGNPWASVSMQDPSQGDQG